MDATAFDRDFPGGPKRPNDMFSDKARKDWTGKMADFSMRMQEAWGVCRVPIEHLADNAHRICTALAVGPSLAHKGDESEANSGQA